MTKLNETGEHISMLMTETKLLACVDLTKVYYFDKELDCATNLTFNLTYFQNKTDLMQKMELIKESIREN